MLTHEQALERLRNAALPTRAQFARKHGISPAMLCCVLKEVKPMSPRLAAVIGLKPMQTQKNFSGVPRHRQPKRFYVEVGQ